MSTTMFFLPDRCLSLISKSIRHNYYFDNCHNDFFKSGIQRVASWSVRSTKKHSWCTFKAPKWRRRLSDNLTAWCRPSLLRCLVFVTSIRLVEDSFCPVGAVRGDKELFDTFNELDSKWSVLPMREKYWQLNQVILQLVYSSAAFFF